MPLSIAQITTLACLLEATASKPGNVHRGADFDDVTFGDFAISAVAIGPAMEQAADRGVGATILSAVQATRALVPSNTNLGIVLLLAPLAAVPREVALRDGVVHVLQSLTADDSAAVYQAIALAKPGGLGESREHDVSGPPPASLLEAMQLAADRDAIARQYVTNFNTVFEQVVVELLAGVSQGWTALDSIVHTHVSLLATSGDTLIARKCGQAVSDEAAAYARQVLSAGRPGEESYYEALADLDFWLRLDGHRRNPGTTADLIAAGLFVALREGQLAPPWN
ncbi:MAG TPA: triphosphoribosyl-dephospho-CoA synthase [Pirellulaceae bacterium]|nr:triphosphoribosyl-dephospho-CoA synthase [Pirellulaceae bacterium]